MSEWTFQKTAVKRPELGEWKPLWSGAGWSATICCPSCRREATLLGHTIQAGGVVSPSVVCPAEKVQCPNCKFHVHATLKGWADFIATAVQPAT